MASSECASLTERRAAALPAGAIRTVRLLGIDDPVDGLDPVEARRIRGAEAQRRWRLRRGAKPRGVPTTTEAQRKRNRAYYERNAERLRVRTRERYRHEREFHIMHYAPSGRHRSAKAGAAARWAKQSPGAAPRSVGRNLAHPWRQGWRNLPDGRGWWAA